ncbi:protocadherin-1-like isoform X2 [Babylonia areolata]|uniref:protocadherin-1-like isoform X2 n=1 Tax=Babylonia areolata TaxID=304850 RepID=UPI003FD303D7
MQTSPRVPPSPPHHHHHPLSSLPLLPLLLLLFLLLLQPAPAGGQVFYSIKEELSPGTIFGYIVDDSNLRRKVSPDELSNLRFSFLRTGNPYSQYFSVQPTTGVLAVAQRIDRESVCSFRQDCQLTVSAVAQSELGPFFHIIRVVVEVADINDNPPAFSQPVFEVTVPENAPLGLSYPLPTAYDQDTGSNNTVKDYFLVSGHNTFSLTTTRDEVGNIQTALQLLRQLNREHTSAITVLVGARDGGSPPLTGTLTVRVVVADVNDNYPVFDRYAYNVNVSETTRTNHPLLQVHAEDADVGPNGNLTYRFSKLQPKEVLKLFTMDGVSGKMFLAQSVENQTGRIFELVVEATDHGSPPKVSRALVRVRVLDTVNSRPDIMVDILRSSATGQSEVSEYSEVGKVVAYVSVADPDSGENGVTVCHLNTKDFELQPLSSQGQYKVILVTNLDRERIARYHIAVTCTDFGFPPLENSKRFQVNVRDENDNAPAFSQRSYFASLRENGTAGAVVTTLSVTDADVGPNAQVTFRVAAAHRQHFSITANGTMLALGPLDREVSERLVVKVLAVDQGYPPLTGSATVFITLEDVNDMAPRFTGAPPGGQGYSFSVSEDARPGTFVGIVAARDDDSGINAEVTFVPARPSAPASGLSAFLVTADGMVKTRRRLDRERTDMHFFTVVARDAGSPSLSSTATITIHVDDVNDNTPYFIYPSETNDSLSIPHTYPTHTPITQIRAMDRDAGQNAALVYSCASVNDSGLFGMDPTSGDLYLHRYLSRRQVGLYILRVAAHDEGTPQLSNQTVLFLDVFFDNSTLLDSAKKAAPSTALITALVLVGVVLVVGVVALAAVICIRRREGRKKHEATSGGQQAPPPKSQSGYYIAPGVCESPAYVGGLSDTVLNKPVPEQSLDGAGGSGHDPGPDAATLRSVNPYVIMPPHSNYSDPDGQPEIIEISRNGLFHRAEDPYPGEEAERGAGDDFSTFRSQDGAYHPHYHPHSLHRQSSEDLDAVKRADDSLSLSGLSNQSTSDSGRGGSEFDVNNAAHRDRGAAMKTSSPMPYKGSGSQAANTNTSFRSRDPEVSFTTFRGDSPCSFRFDSDTDSTLTRPQRQAPPHSSGTHPRTTPHPHTTSLHSLPGGGPRSQPPSYSADPGSGDESGSLGRRGTTPRRALTPGADFAARYGVHGPTFHLASSGPDGYGGRREGQYDRGGAGGDGDYGGRVRRTSTDLPVFTSHPTNPDRPLYGARSSTVPPVDFRGRQSRHPSEDYGSAAYGGPADRDHDGRPDVEPREDEFLLPPYPDLAEEEEEEGEVSERSALNFVPGVTNVSRSSTDSGRGRHSSQV